MSTGNQDLDLQLDALEKCGVERKLIFTDSVVIGTDITVRTDRPVRRVIVHGRGQ